MQKLVVKSVLVAVILVVGIILSSCAPPAMRPDRPLQDMVAARQAGDLARADQSQQIMQGLVARVGTKVDAAVKRAPGTAQPTIDILVISGGGDWGAFGAGIIKGWGRVSGEFARPHFDVVTGVSTGALIAPFAFLGDEASIDRIIHMYRNPQTDWTERGFVFFWPSNPSFYALPGLEREVRKAMDRAMLERIAAEDATGRGLIVNTTNVDFGDMHAWNIIAEAKVAVARNDPARVHRLLLASAGIPGFFPARDIDNYLYVDGAITGNILYGGRIGESDTLPALWQAKQPGVPMPRMRYWVIFNNQFRFPPQVTQERWPEIMGRTMIMSTQTSTVTSIRHLFAQAEIARLKYKTDMQVRVIAVPDAWVPPSPGQFQKDVMNALADMGEQMGADPASWRTEAP